MPDQPPKTSNPMAWEGTIMAAARAHLDTAALWQAIHERTQQAGLVEPPGLWAAVNRIRSAASGVVRGSERLSTASTDSTITARMIGTQPYARDVVQQSLAPLYHVRFELTTLKGATTDTSIYTLEYSGSLEGMTVGELRDQVDMYAYDLAESYGTAFGGVGRIEIGAA